MKFRKIAFSLFLSILSFIGYSQINVGTNFKIVANAPIDTRYQVADTNERNLIAWRYEGLSVFVLSNQSNYQLRGGVANSNWVRVYTSDFTSGTGITLTGQTFSHTPHTGDATGATSLTVVALRGRSLATSAPTSGDVLSWNGSAWAPATAFNYYATGSGLLLSNNTFSALNSLALWNANQLQGTPISTLAPSNNTQVLKYDGTNWIPTNEVVYTAGTGITLITNTFSHTPHTGDAIGATSLTVVALQGVSISSTAPTTAQLLRYNGTRWIPSDETAYTAGTGITISGTTFSHTAHTGDAIGATSLTVVALQGVSISSAAPTTTQLLRYNGTRWIPSDETAYAAGTGIALISNTFINTGDLSSINELQNLSYVPATRVLGISTGSGVTLPLFTPTEPGLVPAATTGSALIFLNGAGAWTAPYNAGSGITISGNTLSHTPHTGDALGSASLTVVAIQGRSVVSTAPTNGDILAWNGSSWVPATAFSNYATGSGILLSGNTFSALNSLAIWNANQLQGTPISTLAPSNNTQVLKYNGTSWIPTNEVVYTSGTGITLSSNTFSHTAHTGDAIGATSLTVVAIQGRTLASTTPTNGDILAWNGSSWAPATAFSNYATGSGILLSGNTFSALNSLAIWNANQLYGTSISSLAPSNTQVLRYNGTNWIPSNEVVYAAGSGLTLVGNTFINSGDDLSSTNELQTLTASGTTTPAINLSLGGGSITYTGSGGVSLSRTASNIDINSLTYAAGTGITLSTNTFSHTPHTGDAIGATSLTVVAIRGRSVATTIPSNGDVITWDTTSSTWKPGQSTTGQYNGNRPVKRTSWPYNVNMNTGTTGSVKQFLDAVFFPFISATIEFNAPFQLLFEIGTTNTVTVSGATTPWDETIFSLGRIDKIYTGAPTQIYSFGSSTTFSTTVTFSPTQVVSTQDAWYRAYQTVANNGSQIVINSNVKYVQSCYPYLHGVSSIDLSTGGTAAYATLSHLIQTKSNKTIPLTGTNGYIYFCYPATYGDLTSILDHNNFEQITSFTKFTVNVISVGLVNNWSESFNIYKLNGVTSPAGWNYIFKY